MREGYPAVFRHELKYPISAAQLPAIQNRINNLLSLDSHAASSKGYTIRSLYFDDYDNHCFWENEDGTDPREKFRIRIYNHSTQRITLECKRKERGKTYKTSCPLTLAQTKRLMEGKTLSDIGGQPPLLQKLTVEMMTRRLQPVVIVEYDRIPYVYVNGNVRITLDTNISSSKAVGCFLDETVPKRPVMPLGQQLLEVKYDEFLPDFIYRNLQLENLQQTAFSKYYICRKYTR
ncbi:MAG: polyphosphate polymerase domain-containing protein [Eubacteriales bacterium]|nr:polyphosphate polymerase domain-containing protein [Eubacteriales bacterium]